MHACPLVHWKQQSLDLGFGSYTMDAPNPYHVRSNSLPSKSHPILHQLNEKLLRFSYCDARQTASCPVDSLVDIYNDSEDFLRLPLVHEAIRRQHIWVDEILDETLILMDMCSKMNDAIARVREQQAGVLSALRRRDHTALRGQIGACILAQKKMTKELANSLGTLQKTYKSVSYQSQDRGSSQDDDVPCVP
ncbi:hypothetical protein AMTR_s00001p00234110 [Amborella trichopoda]|uniref:Uncharacterized protein n=2 Tax=Amborella trichopoda TaxID=13333 RepID=W1NLK7_AMBTC|nr:hypothetical protein AMTR_s00001p00234110 [Amborella trichopoda]